MASRRIKEKKEEPTEENKEVEEVKEEKVDEVKEEKVSEAKEESDEITIDFSWIKKGLKKLTAEEEVKKKEEKKSNKDEVEIDFSWVKKGLKKLTEEDKTEDKKKEDEEDIQLDMKKIKGFFSLNKKKQGLNLGKIFGFLQKRQILLLLLIPLFLSFHFRVQTATLPLTEQLATDAWIPSDYRSGGSRSQMLPEASLRVNTSLSRATARSNWVVRRFIIESLA